MSEKDINRWHNTITPRDKAPQPWTVESSGSWDMLEVQPIPDEMLAELMQRYNCAGTPWNCRSLPLSPSDREYMFLLYYSMQGLVARMRLAERDIELERNFAATHENKALELISEIDQLKARVAELERDAGRQQAMVEDLAALINRLCRKINKVSPADNDVAVKAAEYLFRNNLIGTSLRRDDEGIRIVLDLVRDAAIDAAISGEG